jgi:hypothetical protein
MGTELLDGLPAIVRLRDELEIGLRRKQQGDSSPDHGMIIDDHEANELFRSHVLLRGREARCIRR